jgi:hypothetical protein
MYPDGERCDYWTETKPSPVADGATRAIGRGLLVWGRVIPTDSLPWRVVMLPARRHV